VKRPAASRPYANGAGSLISDLLSHAHARACCAVFVRKRCHDARHQRR
jgi:hypothetical protein